MPKIIDSFVRLAIGCVLFFVVSNQLSGGSEFARWLANSHYRIYEILTYIIIIFWCYAIGSWVKDRIERKP